MFPHSEICGSKLICSSPQLIAACHVLHRLLMPRHSPCALVHLTVLLELYEFFVYCLPLYGKTSISHCSVFKVHRRNYLCYSLPNKFESSPLWCCSFFIKSHARFACSLVNALTTAHCHYQLFMSFLCDVKSLGGPRWTRTTDLTLIRRAL